MLCFSNLCFVVFLPTTLIFIYKSILIEMRFYVIEGNIGVGKTSLTGLLSEKHGARAVYEQFADNPFLPKFYQKPDKYAFALELSFLADRYSQLKTEIAASLFSPFIISDYYFSKSLIFARQTLAEDEYDLYLKLYNIILSKMPKPSVYIYLNQTTDRLMENIRKRGRSYESNITEEYLHKIQEGYLNYFKQISDFPVIIINCFNLDFINNNEHLSLIDDIIFNKQYNSMVHHIDI